MIEFRVGHGYDVHRLVEGRNLVLGGVYVPHIKGLLGHSDADVLVHAIIDSMLGAAALGDIGSHFPDNDDRFKGISSILLLKEAARLIAQKGYKVGNIDATLILQRPKVAPYIRVMRDNIAEALNLDCDAVNIKATTEEGLGFSGREEGIAAHAVCLLIREKGASRPVPV